MDGRRHEAVAERVHPHQRGHHARVAEVVGVDATGQAGRRRRLDRDHPQVLRLAGQLVGQERVGEAGEVAAPADAADDDVRVGPGHVELALRLDPDHGLVQEHVVEDGAERVLRGGLVRHRVLDRLADREAERARARRVLREPLRGRCSCRGSGTPRPSRPTSPSCGAGRASGRSSPAPCRSSRRSRRAARRRRGSCPTGRRPSRWRGASRPPAGCRRPARPRCSACGCRRGSRPRTCRRSSRGSGAPSRAGGRGRAGVGRHSRYTSRTGSGISTQRSFVTSCWMRAIGKSGARSAGPTGCFVPGWSTGGRSNGRSAWRLYQAFGISDSGRTNFVWSVTSAPPGRENADSTRDAAYSDGTSAMRATYSAKRPV